MIDFSAHELELISDSIDFEFDLPVLQENPDCPRALQLRSIQARIDAYLQSIQPGTREGSVL